VQIFSAAVMKCGLRIDFGFYIPRSAFRIPHFIS